MLKTICFLSLSIFFFGLSYAQQSLPVIRSNTPYASVRVGNDVYQDAWKINSALKPDIQNIPIKGSPLLVAFITALDSIGFYVEGGKDYDFIILVNDKDSAYTRIRGEQFTNPAHFTAKYKATHTNKNFVEIPEVYELINIIFAITPTGKKDHNIVDRSTPYYKEVLHWFDSYREEPVVRTIDSLLQMDKYAVVKMDAYSFSFDKKGRIIPSAVYDRVSWGSSNTLKPYTHALQQFATKTGFRKFYKKHQDLYNQQIAYYADSAGIDAMNIWLNQNFPGTRYHSFKIIFSPLVYGNQSANWFEDNDFKEAQAHVNFPYTSGNWLKGLSPAAANIRRGNIVFTELNHAFINPDAEKPLYDSLIEVAFSPISSWAQKGKPAAGYSSAFGCFTEHLNWLLVNLRYVDVAPKEELPLLLKQIEDNMTESRGFTKFRELSRFAVPLYQNRKPGETVADLYPAIIEWCIQHK